MNKAELVDAIAAESGLTKADAERAVKGFVGAVGNALKKGDRIFRRCAKWCCYP